MEKTEKSWIEMSDKALIDEFLSYNPDCIGVSDVMRHEVIAAELEDRGFDIIEVVTHIIKKDGVEVEEFDKDGKAIV